MFSSLGEWEDLYWFIAILHVFKHLTQNTNKTRWNLKSIVNIIDSKWRSLADQACLPLQICNIEINVFHFVWSIFQVYAFVSVKWNCKNCQIISRIKISLKHSNAQHLFFPFSLFCVQWIWKYYISNLFICWLIIKQIWP